MFKIAENRIVKWPVTINIPRDGGKVVKARMSVDFDLLTQQEFDEIYENGGKDVDMLERVIKGWDDAQAADGTSLLFSDEARSALIDISYVRVAFVGAYLQASQGREAARKN